MHKVRRAVIGTLIDNEWLATGAIAAAIQYPTVTARRALEELHAHGVVDCAKGGSGKSDSWQLSEWTRRTLDAIKTPIHNESPTFPVFPTDDISSSSLDEIEDDREIENSPAKYTHPEKRERSEINLATPTRASI
jgi:DNA-binding transcriptional MocR family regulator